MQVRRKQGFKRKSGNQTNEVRQKKSKVEDDTVTLLFSNLPEEACDEGLNNLVLNANLNVRIKSCRANYKKRIAYVDFNFWEVKRALKLNNTEWLGEKIKVHIDGEDLLNDYNREQNEDEFKNRFTLFCKNLSYQADEREIMQLFKGVKEVRLVRDRISRKSKGFAYIDFKTKDALNEAAEQKGKLKHRGRKLHLEIIDADSQKSTNNETETVPSKTLYVKGVSRSMDKNSLLKNFEGSTDVRIMKDSKTSGYTAYITFESEDAAQTAYELGQGVTDIATTLKVEYMKGLKSSKETKTGKKSKLVPQNKPHYKLLCRNLPNEAMEQEIAGLFYDVEDVTLVRNKGKSKRLAYVTFKSKEALDEALESSPTLQGRRLFLKMCAESLDTPVSTTPNKTLIVRGITANMDGKTLMKHFIGSTNAQVVHSDDGKEKIGYVEYESEEAAKEAADEYKGEKEVIGSVFVQFVKENVNEKTILCVRGALDNIDEATLKKSFDGAVQSYIVKDNQSGRKRVGYVKFDNGEDAEKVFKSSKDGWDVNGVKLSVVFAKRRVQCKSVMVRGVTSNISEDMLMNAFKGASEVRIPMDKNIGCRKGIAFVEFESELDALRVCLNNRGGIEVDGSVLSVYSSKNRNRKPIKAPNQNPKNPKMRLY